MGEFLAEINFTEFKKLKASQLRKLKSAEIFADGEYLFTFINGNTEPSGYLRMKCQYAGASANAVGGETMEKLLETEAVPA